MSEGTEKLRAYATSDREQATILEWFSGLADSEPRAAQLQAQAYELWATADGWDEIAQAAEDQVDDPDA